MAHYGGTIIKDAGLSAGVARGIWVTMKEARAGSRSEDDRLKGVEAANGGTFQNVRSWRQYHAWKASGPWRGLEHFQANCAFTPPQFPTLKIAFL